MTPGIDPACLQLAEHVLQDDGPAFTDASHALRVDALASEIQLAVESWYDAHAEADADIGGER